MRNTLKIALLVLTFALCRTAKAGTIYQVALDTSSLVGHPAGPFYFEVAITDGEGFGDANNTANIGAFNFGGGSALGSPFLFGGANGSLETGVSLTDSSFLGLFSEQFAPGLLLTFSLDITSNDDANGIPDGLSFFLLDSSGVALPTLAPSGDYFLGAALGSSGTVFDAWGSDPTRSPTVGIPLSIPSPTITLANSTPEPSTKSLFLVGGFAIIFLTNFRRRRKIL